MTKNRFLSVSAGFPFILRQKKAFFRPNKSIKKSFLRTSYQNLENETLFCASYFKIKQVWNIVN
jgi:hypothetical protein